MLNLKRLERITLHTAVNALRWYAKHDPKSIDAFLDGAYVDDYYMAWKPLEFWEK